MIKSSDNRDYSITDFLVMHKAVDVLWEIMSLSVCLLGRALTFRPELGIPAQS